MLRECKSPRREESANRARLAPCEIPRLPIQSRPRRRYKPPIGTRLSDPSTTNQTRSRLRPAFPTRAAAGRCRRHARWGSTRRAPEQAQTVAARWGNGGSDEARAIVSSSGGLRRTARHSENTDSRNRQSGSDGHCQTRQALRAPADPHQQTRQHRKRSRTRIRARCSAIAPRPQTEGEQPR